MLKSYFYGKLPPQAVHLPDMHCNPIILSKRKHSPLHHNKSQPETHCPSNPSRRANPAGSELPRARAKPAATQHQSRSRWLHRYCDITRHHFPPAARCLWRGHSTSSCSPCILLPVRKAETPDLLQHIPPAPVQLKQPRCANVTQCPRQAESKFQQTGEMPAAVRHWDVQIAAGDLRERNSPGPGAPTYNPSQDAPSSSSCGRGGMLI